MFNKNVIIIIASAIVMATVIFYLSFYSEANRGVKRIAPHEAMIIDPIEFGDHYGITAFAYSVIKDGAVVKQSAAGKIHINSEIRANEDHYFQLGSCTKGFTALLAGRMVDSGLIDWDTKFFDLFPEWRASAHPSYHSITLSDLLSHRAGISPYTHKVMDSELHLVSSDPGERKLEFCKMVLAENNGVVKEFNYSNAGYSLASIMLEKVSGKAWDEAVSEMSVILGLEPLTGRPNENDINQPWGHILTWHGTLRPVGPDDYFRNSPVIAPAGALSMKIGDVSGYIINMLRSLNGTGGCIKQPTAEFILFGKEKYSIGWANNFDGETYAFHSGSDGSYYSHIMIFKELNSAIIIMTTAPSCKRTMDFIDDFRNFLKIKYIYNSDPGNL